MRKTNLTLSVFTLMNFVLAMTGSVFGGILDQVAVSLNVSVASAGLLNTMYAYGAGIGVPIILIAFRKIDRTKMLKITLFITILTALALIYAKDFTLLLIIRLIMGISAGSYSVLAIATVMSLSAKERQGRSMAILIMGNALATIIGIPLTRALSGALDWRDIFWILNVIMALSIVYFMVALPKGDPGALRLNLKEEFSFLRDGKTLLVIIGSLIMFIGYYALYNYITPYLLILFPATEAAMTLILILLGVASFVGNSIGGHVADRIGYQKALLFGAVVQAAAVTLILIAQSVLGLSLAAILFWMMSAWFIGLQLNAGIAQVTANKSSFMISLNSSAIQLGGAIGSSLAAIVISGSGIQNIVFITLLSCLGVIAIGFISIKKGVST